MISDIIEGFSEEQYEIIKEVENMLVPELMSMIGIGQKDLDDSVEKFMHCSDEESEDMFTTIIGHLLTLRYYHQVLDKRDVDNMKVGDLRKEYEEFYKKADKEE